MKIRRSVVTNIFLLLSVILFLVSLALPGIYFATASAEQCRDFRTQPLSDCEYRAWNGGEILLLGWIEVSLASPAWYANLLMPVLWWDMKRTKLQGVPGSFLSIGCSLLALSSLLVTTVRDGHETGARAYVQSFGLGFYLWTASFLVCIVGYAITRMRRDAS
jgi:hypothetical protein